MGGRGSDCSRYSRTQQRFVHSTCWLGWSKRSRVQVCTLGTLVARFGLPPSTGRRYKVHCRCPLTLPTFPVVHVTCESRLGQSIARTQPCSGARPSANHRNFAVISSMTRAPAYGPILGPRCLSDSLSNCHAFHGHSIQGCHRQPFERAELQSRRKTWQASLTMFVTFRFDREQAPRARSPLSMTL